MEKLTSVAEGMAGMLGTLKPFKYCGHVWDKKNDAMRESSNHIGLESIHHDDAKGGSLSA